MFVSQGIFFTSYVRVNLSDKQDKYYHISCAKITSVHMTLVMVAFTRFIFATTQTNDTR